MWSAVQYRSEAHIYITWCCLIWLVLWHFRNICSKFRLWFRCVGTLHCSRSSSVSCRLRCLALSFFTPLPTPPWKEEGCVFVWKAHLAEKETYNPTPPPTDLKPPISHLLFLRPPSHLPPFPPSQAPRGEIEICVWGWWCHSWQPEVLEFRAVNRRNCLTLFTTHADSGICMWKLKQLLLVAYRSGKNKAYGHFL